MFRGLLEILLAHRHSRAQWDAGQGDLGRDRRVFRRVALKVPCRLANPMFGLEASGTTLDVSLEGSGLTAPVNWSEGSRIRMQLDPPALDVDGIIVYRKQEAQEPPQFRYGVKFQSLGFLQIYKLRRFLKQNHSGRLSE